MKKRFVVEFEDGSAAATGERNDGISIEYSDSGDERLKRFDLDGVPFVAGNRAGLLTLGKLLIQLGASEYKTGFHLHLREDFDADKPEILILGVDGSD
jgi:hypothetical protein